MPLSTLTIVAIIALLVAIVLFANALLKGGKMLGGFLDRRDGDAARKRRP